MLNTTLAPADRHCFIFRSAVDAEITSKDPLPSHCIGFSQDYRQEVRKYEEREASFLPVRWLMSACIPQPELLP